MNRARRRREVSWEGLDKTRILDSLLPAWTLSIRDVSYSEGVRTDIEKGGHHMRHSEDPRLDPLVHFVARHSVLKKLRAHWLEEEFLAVRQSAQTTPGEEPHLEPALISGSSPDPPIGREFLVCVEMRSLLQGGSLTGGMRRGRMRCSLAQGSESSLSTNTLTSPSLVRRNGKQKSRMGRGLLPDLSS